MAGDGYGLLLSTTSRLFASTSTGLQHNAFISGGLRPIERSDCFGAVSTVARVVRDEGS